MVSSKKKKIKTKQRSRKIKSKKKLTFKCNNSSFLKKLLIDHRFKEISKDNLTCVEFSMWDTYFSGDVCSTIKLLERNYVKPIDDKRMFYLLAEKYNLLNNIPKTFTDIKNLTDEMLDSSKLYFLKSVYGSAGKDVYPVKTMDHIRDIVKGPLDNYILQEEVPNMYLHKRKKTSMRIFVLINEYGIYLYKEGYVYIYPVLYNRKSLDMKYHNNCSVYQDYEKKCTYEKLSNATIIKTREARARQIIGC